MACGSSGVLRGGKRQSSWHFVGTWPSLENHSCCGQWGLNGSTLIVPSSSMVLAVPLSLLSCRGKEIARGVRGLGLAAASPAGRDNEERPSPTRQSGAGARGKMDSAVQKRRSPGRKASGTIGTY